MTSTITYKDKVGVDAIVAWSGDHSHEIDALRRLFAPDFTTIKGEVQSTFNDILEPLRKKLEHPDLLGDLDPSARWNDAKAYMARLVCYVWDNVEPYGSNERSTDYVYRIAREGSRLYADCRYARTLLEKFGKCESTIRKEAKLLHAQKTHFNKTKWGCMEKPPSMSQLAKESLAEEMRQIRQERKRTNR